MKNAASCRPNIFVRKPSLRMKGMDAKGEEDSRPSTNVVDVFDPIGSVPCQILLVADVPGRAAGPVVDVRSSSLPSSSIGGWYPPEAVLDVL